MIPSLLDGEPVYFAHRGLSAKAPENTMAAFALAWESGVRGVELDIRLCASGELVVFHDDNLQRITGADGCVEEATYDVLKDLDAGGWFSPEHRGERIPRLVDVLDSAPPDSFFDIEIKPRDKNAGAIARELAGCIAEYRLENRCIVSSFYPSAVRAGIRASSRRSAAYIYSSSLAQDSPAKLRLAKLLCRPAILKPQWQAAMALLEERKGRENRLPIIPWTVNDPAVAERCIRLGAAGIISDDPTAVAG